MGLESAQSGQRQERINRSCHSLQTFDPFSYFGSSCLDNLSCTSLDTAFFRVPCMVLVACMGDRGAEASFSGRWVEDKLGYLGSKVDGDVWCHTSCPFLKLSAPSMTATSRQHAVLGG